MARAQSRPLVRLVQPLQEFVGTEAAGGIVLFAGAVAALAWANSPWAGAYDRLLEAPLEAAFAGRRLDGSFQFWVNDAAMALFFFLVGLEIKRELTIGELNSLRRAVVPAAAALGGMALPALIFLAIAHDPGARAGWGVPMATDIAFALGIAALLGPRVPLGLKAFLLALAIFDDIGAALVIALFYGRTIDAPSLALAAALVLAMWLLARGGLRSLPVYVVFGALAWLAARNSGVHPALVGVAAGLVTPWRAWQPAGAFVGEADVMLDGLRATIGVPEERRARNELLLHLRDVLEHAIPPLDRLEHSLNAWVAFLIVPLFALVNAGVDLRGGALAEAARSPIAWGVAAGLLLGKPLGILAGAWFAVRLGAQLPEDVRWRGVASIAVVGGVGFTVAIFVAGIAYGDEAPLAAAKFGIFAGSVLAGALGYLLLRVQSSGGEAGSS